ncbi:hypothetical protein ASD62_18335 [Phycicoccus sp. Root563]|uniref:Gmad2 immunoglobulin-like domain-containing protein n=1 Tax=Phycicoccus sp. Root563 TaxID=1736562 RepID=UPI000702793D|nr:Gmad2 immunoglobulin-like domain-containing protein [Phycicoccus sp. Root563]KQZ87529.1 hypothetical protein ASD62_18335 [Phycicoccus sp. Root563]
MSDRTEFLHPDFEPGEFDRIERELRRSLTQESGRMRPTDRLDTILHEAHRAGPVTATGGTGMRRWLAPAAAAAVVAAIAGGVWLSNQDPTATPGPPAGSPSATVPAPTATGPSVTDQPTTAPTQTSSPTTSPNSGPGVVMTFPAYFVGPVGGSTPTYKLFREFIRQEVAADPTPADKVTVALTLAMNAQPYSNTDGYLQPWSGTTVTAATVANDVIEVRLSGPGAEGFTPEVQRLAVQQLVWTAEAAVGRGPLPVRFEIEGGATKLFGSISTDQSFTRPSADESWKDLAPIWVTAPSRDQVLPSASPVTVKGEASVFEATVGWELTRGTTSVKTGNAMATIGAPSRGTYSFSLGTLAPGTYTVKVYEASAKDGSIAAEDSVTFTVK